MPFATKIRPYRVITFSWSSPPTDEPVGLDAHGIANTFTIMEDSTPLGVAVKLNNESEHLLEGISGVDGVVISEIYITSAETTGAIKLYTAWEAQWA